MDVEILLDKAWDAGITAFDTAPVYGDAEQRLGAWIKRRGVTPSISTKLPALAGVADSDVAEAVDQAIEGSTSRLGVPPATYLAHDTADYLRPTIRSRLCKAAARGAIGAVGLSVYTAEEVFAAIAAAPPAAIQLPLSAFDQRMIASGALAACAAAGVAIFARSIFLQGAMLMEVAKLPDRLAGLGKVLADFETLCTAARSTRASFALRYVRDLPGIASTIVGAYTADQLAALIAIAEQPPLTQTQRAAIDAIAKGLPEKLLDPRNWTQQQ